jgi:tetratricopeptide (TPR) repeat protein
VIAGSGNSCVGSVSRQLGLLAAVMLRWEEAERHFEDALEMHARLGARPFLARTRYEYARMLLARGAPAYREKALGLLNQAIEAAQALGMKRVKLRKSSVQGTPSSRRASPISRPRAAP